MFNKGKFLINLGITLLTLPVFLGVLFGMVYALLTYDYSTPMLMILGGIFM